MRGRVQQAGCYRYLWYHPSSPRHLTCVKFHFGPGVVQGERVTAHQDSVEAPRRRGDKQRHAIVQAVRELLEEKPFAELSVSTISDRRDR